MKKFEYKQVNIRLQVEAIRNSNNARSNEGDEVLFFEFINEMGKDGWRCLNPETGSVAFFEREK